MIWIICYRYVSFKIRCTLTLDLFKFCFR
uniref:Uncharacterized protein n=1 Tax=Arundo donax TaxID=35708 RepID=A0A0A9FUY7_ARUDO